MSSSTVLLKSKDIRTREELADLLVAMADRIREGRLTLSQGTEDLDLELPGSMRVDVEVSDSVKPERTKREVEIEIEWLVDDTGAPVTDDAGGGLTVT